MTKRETLNALKTIEEIRNNEELVNFINHEIELLDRERKPSKATLEKRKENERLEEIIYNYLEDFPEGRMIKEMIADIPELDECSTSKVVAIVKYKDRISKEIRKGKTYWMR